MARRPSFQFYPADHLANSNLSRCTHEEKGVWWDFISHAHDGADYGILRWPLKEIGQAIGCKVAVLTALVKKEVLKGADPGDMCQAYTFTPYHSGKRGPTVVLIQAQPGPLWYSSRMVLDEYKRVIKAERSKETQFKADQSESPNPEPNPTPMPPFGDGSSSTSSFSSFNPLLRSDSQPQIDPVLLGLPCQKEKVYHITQAELDRWQEAFPEIDPMAQARKMNFWLEGNPTKRKSHAGMGRFISGWLGKAQKDHQEAPQAKPTAKIASHRSACDQEYLEQFKEDQGA